MEKTKVSVSKFLTAGFYLSLLSLLLNIIGVYRILALGLSIAPSAPVETFTTFGVNFSIIAFILTIIGLFRSTRKTLGWISILLIVMSFLCFIPVGFYALIMIGSS